MVSSWSHMLQLVRWLSWYRISMSRDEESKFGIIDCLFLCQVCQSCVMVMQEQ